MDYLEAENERLKQELKQALEEIASLREENLQLKSQLKDPQAKIKQVVREQQANQESTFITKGAENPTVPCDNCSKEIDKSKLNLHLVYCLKNITKCPYCKLQVDVKELQSHIDDSLGQKPDLIYAAQSGNLDLLRRVQLHGGEINKLINEYDANNSLLHYAVKNNQKEVVEFLEIIGMNMDVQNKFGETALHVCSGQSGNLELAKLLILKGANYTLKNQLGDSPLDLAKRYGNHEISMMFNSAAGGGGPASQQNSFLYSMNETHSSLGSAMSLRKTKSQFNGKPISIYQSPTVNSGRQMKINMIPQ